MGENSLKKDLYPGHIKNSDNSKVDNPIKKWAKNSNKHFFSDNMYVTSTHKKTQVKAKEKHNPNHREVPLHIR